MVPSWECGGESRTWAPCPPRFLLFGQLWARKAAGLFLVGLSPGRRDVQKSTGQGEGLAKVRVRRQAQASGRAGGQPIEQGDALGRAGTWWSGTDPGQWAGPGGGVLGIPQG